MAWSREEICPYFTRKEMKDSAVRRSRNQKCLECLKCAKMPKVEKFKKLHRLGVEALEGI